MPDADPKDQAVAFDALVEYWFFEMFHGSSVARSTDVWNTVFAAKDELKRRVAAWLAEGARD